jgi:hypothetical protein
MWQALVVMMVMAAPPAGGTAEGRAARADASDPAQRLAQAMRTGTFDAADAVSIVGWVLNEREERVAEGFLQALRTADVTGGRKDARWDPAARAMVRLFERALSDAAAHRRSSGEWSEVEDLLKAAAPALAAALRDGKR